MCDVQFTSHCAEPISNLTTAISKCHSKGGFLATPQSRVQQETIYSLMGNSIPSLLGGYDAHQDFVFRWVDGPLKDEIVWVGLGTQHASPGRPGVPGLNMPVAFDAFYSQDPEPKDSISAGSFVIEWLVAGHDTTHEELW